MRFLSVWPWSNLSPGDYKSVDTELSDEDDKYSDRLKDTKLVDVGTTSSCDLDEEESGCRCSREQPRSQPLLVKVIFGANVLLFLASTALFVVRVYQQPVRVNSVYRQVTTYSPVLDDIKIPFVDKQVQGDLFPAENKHDQLLGRREPGPETDDLWLDFEIQRPFLLTREQVLALGKDPEKTVKYPDEVFGLGPEAYMGGMDVFHVLHCFNTIRKEAFKDYYFDGEKYHMEAYGEESTPRREHSELFWIHLRHCTDIIVQFLMCNADTTMTTMTWLETQSRPWPDFSVNKKCIDFDTLVRWRDENSLDIKDAGMVRRPPGAPETKISDMYWRIMGNETHPGDKTHHPIWG